MAEILPINGTQVQGKVRNPLGVVGLALVTLGIYYWVWYFKVNKEMAAMGRAKGSDAAGTSPGTSLLAVTLGALVIVPVFVSTFKACKRLNAAEELTGVRQGMDAGLLWLLLILLGPVGMYLFQLNLNKTLAQQAAIGPAAGATGLQPA